MRRFDDKVYIVTAGANGIGRATAMRLTSEGGTALVTDIAGEAGQETVEEIERQGGAASYLHVGVRDEKEVVYMVARAVSKYGRLDGAVSNAGAAPPSCGCTS